MKRRSFLARTAAVAVGGAALSRAPFASADVHPEGTADPLDPKLARDWLERWEQSILKSSRQRYCDRETGEEIGWLVSPFLDSIDVEGIVTAFEHGLVFDKTDLQRLIATNRDFMWNQKVEGAAFQRIDGGRPDARWKNSPGVLWTALVPHDPTLRRLFLANHKPDSWGGIATTPWFLAREGVLRSPKP